LVTEREGCRRQGEPGPFELATAGRRRRLGTGKATGACFIIVGVLILTRRSGERVVIDEDILIEVMEVSGHTVRLGISAPDGVSVYREEIWLAVKEESRAAAAADPFAADQPAPAGRNANRGRFGAGTGEGGQAGGDPSDPAHDPPLPGS